MQNLLSQLLIRCAQKISGKITAPELYADFALT